MKRLIVLVAVVILAAPVGYLVYRQSGFKVLSSSPRTGGTVSGIEPIKIDFNRELDPANVNRVSISPRLSGDTTIQGRRLTFQPKVAYQIGTQYTLTVQEPLAASGITRPDVTVRVKAIYRSYSQESADQRQIEQSRVDQLEHANPILKELPIETNHYRIDYRDHGDGFELLITLYAGSSNVDIYRQQLAEYKTEAESDLRNRGYEISKYRVVYDPPN